MKAVTHNKIVEKCAAPASEKLLKKPKLNPKTEPRKLKAKKIKIKVDLLSFIHFGVSTFPNFRPNK